MDGNTRLCTATAAAALKETFGTDGQPGSYTDLDVCDASSTYGHNVAETQTVLWARMLDRMAGADPPRHVCVDPRRTKVAVVSEVHLAVRPGTNQAVMNGLLREVIHRGWVDSAYVEAHIPTRISSPSFRMRVASGMTMAGRPISRATTPLRAKAFRRTRAPGPRR